MTAAPVELRGLQGNNPFDFLAALGVQVAFEYEEDQPSLWWSDDVIPFPIVSAGFEFDRISRQAQTRLKSWLQGTNFTPVSMTQESLKKWLSLKLKDDDAREFLSNAATDKYAGRFYMALIAEGSRDNNGASKPTDLYFTAGQMQFLKIVREVIENVTPQEIVEDLRSGTPKELERKTLLLNVADDAIYALSSRNPSGAIKFVKPGIEALSILGLSCIPVFGSSNRTLTQGCSGSWKRGTFEWPIWKQPATSSMVRSILAATTPLDPNRQESYYGWSVHRIYRSVITRHDQGGYGTFKPAEIAWSTNGLTQEKRREAPKILDKAADEAQANGLTHEKLTELIESDD